MTDTLDEVFRREAGRCTATLIRVLGDIDLAEDTDCLLYTSDAADE